MTWFLKHASAAPSPEVPAIDGPTPGWGQQAGAAAVDFWKRRDTWNSADQYRNELTLELMQALAPDGRLSVAPEDQREYQDPRTRGHYLARQLATLQQMDTGGRFAGMPVTPEQFDAEVLRRRKRDFDENRAVLDRGDSTTARIAGGIGGGIVDPWNAATLPIGGGGGALKYIGTQAALGAATELPGVATEQGVAKELGFTPENPVAAVGMAAAGSAILGGAVYGAGRAIDYVRTSRAANNAARPAHVAGADYEDGLAAAADDMRMGRDPAPMAGPAQIDDGYFAAIRSAESGGNDAAKNPLSSATGRYQFVQGTWRMMMRKHPHLGLTEDGRLDPAQQERAIRAFTADNAALLQKDGIPINRGNLYAAHFLGAGDARRVLTAGADARLTDILSPDVIRANKFLKDMTVRDFNAWTARKTNGPSGGAPTATTDAGITPVAQGWNGPIRGPNYFDQVTTPAGTSVDVEYRVVDLSDLRAASGDLQPRDRSRVTSDEQIAEIAARLDPRRLMPSAEADRGAPVVGPDSIVESGNGRVAALRRAATEHPDRYQAYVDEIRAGGFEIPEGVREPVLIASRRGDMDLDARRAFVRENNTSGIARMSATEQAATNADYLTQRAFDAYQPGMRLGAPENTEFLRRVFSAMPQAERAPFIGSDSRLTIDGLRMLRQSMFHRAFPADDLLRLLAETESPALASLLRMMEDIAPDWAAFRAAVDAGYVRPEFDITDQLVDMIRQIAKARMDGREGQSVIAALRDRLATGDMFAARDADMTEALLGVFYKGDRARPAEATQAILQRYIADAQAVGRADIGDLLDEGVTPAQALARSVEAQDARAPMPELARAADEAEGPAGPLGDLRGLSGDPWPEGAASPQLVRATDGALRDMTEAPETGPFGPIIRGLEGKWQEAIAELKQRQAGDVPGALSHPHTGPIDLIWGNAGTGRGTGHGLAKILARHPEMEAELQPRLTSATTVITDSPNRVRLTNGQDMFVIRRDDGEGNAKTWLLTAYERAGDGKVQRSDSRTTVRADELPEGSSPSEPLQVKDNPPAASDQDGSLDPDGIDAEIAAARAAFTDQPDLEIRLGEGPDAPVMTLSEVLDQLDRDRGLLDGLTSCNLKGTPK